MYSDSDIEAKVLEAVDGVVKDTDWAPPKGGVLVDVLVIMIHADKSGHRGCSWINTGSNEQAEGMARKVIRGVEYMQIAAMRKMEDDE